jgi:glycosyltransferase involved in cell wall biosynthesis
VGEAALHPEIRGLFPRNVRVTGKVSKRHLLSYYQKASFYCQLSRHEGFGVAVAEAMACKCVPIVSDAGALPEVVGSCGLIVPEGDPSKAAIMIENYIGKMHDLANSARSRVAANFSVEKRASQLRRVIFEMSMNQTINNS